MTVRLDDETERKLGELAEGLPSASAAVKAAIREAWQRLQDAKLDAAYADADAVAEDVAFPYESESERATLRSRRNRRHGGA